MISKDDLNGLNFDRLDERRDELERFDGMLPILLYNNISLINHEKYISDDIKQAYSDRREMYIKFNDEEAYEYEIEELLEWISNNPQFMDLILLSEK